LVILALLNFHGLVDLPEFKSFGDREFDATTGEVVKIERLCGPGIFNDPNDLCLILGFGTLIALHFVETQAGSLMRLLFMMPVGLFSYALLMTRSRGGLLAFLSGVGAYLMTRFGVRRALPLAFVALLAAPLVLSGRQAEISTSSGTGQDRIRIWSEGLMLFQQSPLFGIGSYDFREIIGIEAHNSYVHMYTELGLLGGTLFSSIFFIGAYSLHRLKRAEDLIADPQIRRLRPTLLAILVNYFVGYMSLSRGYTPPPYLVFAIISAYLEIVRRATGVALVTINPKTLWRLCLCSGLFFAGLYTFVRLFVRF
jgi:O-antigen ligase